MADVNSNTFDFETKLWILLPIYDGNDVDAKSPPEFEIVYDCYHGFVIEATTEGEARRIASDSAGDEGKAVWLNPQKVSCELLVPDGTPGIVLSDFHAG